LKLKSGDELITKGEELQKAFLAMDANYVSTMFSNFFSTISFYQRPDQEKTFHSYVQLILSAMGFKVLTEIPGSEGRLDLCLELADKVYLIIELKYCPDESKLTEDERNIALAKAAEKLLPNHIYTKTLAQVIENKLSFLEYRKVISKVKKNYSTEEELNQYLAETADEYLTEMEILNALAEVIEKALTNDEVKQVLSKVDSKSKLPDEIIEAKLSKAAQQALDDAKTRNYQGIVKLNANVIIDLGLAIYGVGSKVKAIFGQKWSKDIS
jgi:DNA-binding ferritin-like protein (Dps family)